MGFWHIAFLAGMATFAIPVIIHLTFRLRKRRLVFSSLRFLQSSVLRQSQRLRLRELLLLLLRCAACILIALAFARPFRSNSALISGERTTEDVALVLDDSPSLMAQEGTNIRWSALIEKARKEVLSHPHGDRIALILTSEPSRAEIELSGNFGAISSALQRDRASFKRGDLGQALNSAIELLATSHQSARRIIVYSDWQTNQIDRGAWSEAAQKAASAGRGITVKLEAPFEVKPERLENLAVTDTRPKSDVWIEGRPIPFAARISNYGDDEHPNIVVKLMANGKLAATRSLALGPRSSQEFELLASFPRSGEVFGSVEIEASDAFPDDDHYFFALRLRDHLRAVIIEEHLNEKDSFLDEGYYVRMALEPKFRATDAFASNNASAVASQNYVQTQTITTSQITSDICHQADIIILVGISALKATELAILEEAARDGRNLILFTGRSDGRLSETFYNGPFWKNGLGLLPARPGTLYEGNRLEGKYHKVGDFKIEHPIFKMFAGENEPFLRLPWFTRHFQTNADDLKIGIAAAPDAQSATTTGITQKTHPPGEVLATFSDGAPLAMERPYGKGSVLMFTFAPRPEATDLVKRKVFVPLLHQAVRHLSGISTTSRQNLIVGEQFDFIAAGATAETSVLLTKPGAKKEMLSLTGNDHPAADVDGIYTLEFKKEAMTERRFMAVNLDARESDLNSENLDALRAIFTSNSIEKSNANNAPSGQDARVPNEAPWDDERKSQAPDWRYFLVTALVCLLLEVLVRDF